MDVVLQIGQVPHLQAFEAGVFDEFMSGNHLVCSQRNHLAIVINHMNHDGESVEFCDIFGFYHQLLAIERYCLFGLSASLQYYLLMLSAEATSHILDLRQVLPPGTAQFGKFEIFQAKFISEYLQKYWREGKFWAPLKSTPTTT